MMRSNAGVNWRLPVKLVDVLLNDQLGWCEKHWRMNQSGPYLADKNLTVARQNFHCLTGWNCAAPMLWLKLEN